MLSRDTYIKALREYFGMDTKRIEHALKVLHYAELIMEGENVNEETRKVVTITALLHDVGIKAAEQKYNSSAGHYQEIEGPPIAVVIMQQQAETAAIIPRVAYIIGGHHTAAKNDGLDFQIIWEADLLVNIEEDELAVKTDNLPSVIAKNFRTGTGKSLARAKYL